MVSWRGPGLEGTGCPGLQRSHGIKLSRLLVEAGIRAGYGTPRPDEAGLGCTTRSTVEGRSPHRRRAPLGCPPFDGSGNLGNQYRHPFCRALNHDLGGVNIEENSPRGASMLGSGGVDFGHMESMCSGHRGDQSTWGNARDWCQRIIFTPVGAAGVRAPWFQPGFRGSTVNPEQSVLISLWPPLMAFA